MSQLPLGFQALYICSRSVNALEPAVDKDGHAQCTGNTSRKPGTVRGTARRPHFSLAFISVTVQLWIQVFLAISVYFNLNILPKSGTFSPRHPVYIVYTYTVSAFSLPFTESYTPTNALLQTIKYQSKLFILKHLKTLQHVSIIIQII